MASQVSPGVVIRERDLTNTTIVGSQALRGAIAAAFQKGPVGRVVAINTLKDFLDTYGAPNDAVSQDWFVAAEFLNYGGRLAVSRAVDSSALTASSSSNEVSAVSPGSWANSLQVIAVDRGFDQIITLASSPSITADGTTLSFSGGKSAKLYQWNEVTKTGNIILEGSSGLIVSSDILDDDDDGDIDVESVSDWYRNTSVSVGNFTLRLVDIGPKPGTSAQGSDLGFSGDEFHIAIVDTKTGVILERYTYLSKLIGGKSPEGSNQFYRESVNEITTNVILNPNPFVGVASTGFDWTSADVSVDDAQGEGPLQIIGFNSYILSGGSDANFVYSSEELEVFRTFDEFDIDFILMGGSMQSEASTLSKVNKIIDIAAERKNCVAFASPDIRTQIGSSGNPLSAIEQKERTLNFFRNLQSTSYAVFDSGYKYIYDRYNDKYRYIPCNGDIAGLCVSTSAQLADWYSPAGLNRGSLKNAIKLAYNPNKSDRDELYSSRINPIVSLRGSGITLFGDKTALSSPSAFDRINVRRLFLNIERRIESLAQGVLFEQNDTFTRSGFASAVNSYLSEIKADRGLTDFLVVCDESNNTPSVIDRNEFVADIYLQPTRSVNFVTITLTATRTGVSFDEVVGR